MQFSNKTRFSLILTALLVPTFAVSESHQEPLYVSVDCMQSQNADYEAMELEIWQPMHQARVDRGQLDSWALYWVLYGNRTDCDYYTVNSYRGLAQLNNAANFNEIFTSVHGEEGFDKAIVRTIAARKHAGTNLWVQIDGVPPGAFQYALVTGMRPVNIDEYIKMEMETWKPIHSALAEKGTTVGWGFYRLFTPSGESQPYEFATVNMLNRLGPLPVQETIEEVHPGMSFDEIIDQAEAARTVVDSEMWLLIASTSAADGSE